MFLKDELNVFCCIHVVFIQEKEIKMAVDETLFEVRRKLTEARRALAVLANIRKLRNLRKDKASRKGSCKPHKIAASSFV